MSGCVDSVHVFPGVGVNVLLTGWTHSTLRIHLFIGNRFFQVWIKGMFLKVNLCAENTLPLASGLVILRSQTISLNSEK